MDKEVEKYMKKGFTQAQIEAFLERRPKEKK